MKAGRLPSASITRLPRYLCAPPTSRPPGSAFGSALYQAIAAITRDERDLPRYPVQLPPHAVPTTPESPPVALSVTPTDGSGLPLLTTESALSIHKSRGSYGFPGSTACKFAILSEESFLDPLSPESRPSKPDLRLRGEPIIPRTGL